MVCEPHPIGWIVFILVSGLVRAMHAVVRCVHKRHGYESNTVVKLMPHH